MSTMLEEIREQPLTVERTLRDEWRTAQALRQWFGNRPPQLVLLAARGTSDNAAQFGRYLIEITTGIPVSLAAPSVFTLYERTVRLDNAAVVAISQSGESTDTNVVLERAQAAGAFTLGITNESGSTLARLAHEVLLVRAGKEISVAATKTYTGQLLCLYLLAYALGAPLRQDDLQQIPDWTGAALRTEPDIADRAERYRFMQHTVCIGRGLNYANSFEFALKLMETCYVVAERFSSADLLHGPIAMLEASFPAFLFCPPGVTWPPMSQVLAKLASIQAESVMITDRSQTSDAHNGKTNMPPIVIPAEIGGEETQPRDLYTPIPYIVPAQMLAAHLAEVKNLDPDQPRTLKKVTKTL